METGEQGSNEVECVNVQSVEVKVDAALIEQLRQGYAALGARDAHAARAGPEGATSHRNPC